MSDTDKIPESVWLTPSEARIDYNQIQCPGANEYILPESLIKCSDCKQSLSECMCGATNQYEPDPVASPKFAQTPINPVGLIKAWRDRKIRLCKKHHPKYGEGASEYSENNCDICCAAIEINRLESLMDKPDSKTIFDDCEHTWMADGTCLKCRVHASIELGDVADQSYITECDSELVKDFKDAINDLEAIVGDHHTSDLDANNALEVCHKTIDRIEKLECIERVLNNEQTRLKRELEKFKGPYSLFKKGP